MLVYLSVQEPVVVVVDTATGGRHLKGDRGSFSVSKSGSASMLEAVKWAAGSLEPARQQKTYARNLATLACDPLSESGGGDEA